MLLNKSLFLLLGLSSCAIAQTAAVDKYSCGKLVNKTEPFVLILKAGDSLHAGIEQCAKDAKLKGATIHGLGQVNNPTFAYYSNDPEEKPKFKTYPGIYEVISLNGNIAKSNENYYTHIHAVLGDEQFQAKAGHINQTEIGVTIELTITPFSKPLIRDVNSETGFGPIVTD